MKGYAFGLWLLWALFCFRVLGQLVQHLHPVSFLPAFDVWQSGVVSYEVLLCSQLLILLLMAFVSYRFSSNVVTPGRRLGIGLLWVGGLYFTLMLGRLIIGLFILPGHQWFGQWLPSLFHLVLALFIILPGIYHVRSDRSP